jgi:hypothetical protein
MSHNWILDVLADLKAYARKNDLSALAEHLDDTRHVAVAEISGRSRAPGRADPEQGDEARSENAGGYRGAV